MTHYENSALDSVKPGSYHWDFATGVATGVTKTNREPEKLWSGTEELSGAARRTSGQSQQNIL